MSEPLTEFFVYDSYLGGGGRRDFVFAYLTFLIWKPTVSPVRKTKGSTLG